MASRAGWLVGMMLMAALAVLMQPELELPQPLMAARDGVAQGAQIVVHAAVEFWAFIGPGGKTHPGWFLDHKGHLVVEGLLLAVITGLFLQRPSKPASDLEELTDQEIDALCEEWRPEPLVPEQPANSTGWQPPVIERWLGGHQVVVEGKELLNLASMDFLGLGDDDRLLGEARGTIQRYGVGSCGPRGFYGTFDVHLDLEAQLAAFMGTQEAIIYAYDIATVASIIPAFCSKPDIVVIDEACSYPIYQGCLLSRARLFTFRHNDLADLEALLARLEAAERRGRNPLCKKMLVVEGVYANTGEVAPLRQLYQLKEKYRYRLCVEESHSFGVLGPTGRGACEAAGLEPGQVEIICASMGGALASVGGFCAGSHDVCDHQRLNGSGYCFSASLPPYLATAASTALAVIADPQQGPERSERARQAAAAFRRALRDSVPGLQLVGDAEADAQSPVLHLRLTQRAAAAVQRDGQGRAAAAGAALQRIAQALARQHGLLVAVPRYSALEAAQRDPTLKLCVNAGLGPKEAAAVATALQKAARSVLGSPQS